jgi:hypothetical protein
MKMNSITPTVSAAGATWGVCQADEFALFVGTGATARMKGNTVQNTLRRVARNACKRPGAAPGAGNVKRHILTPTNAKATATNEAGAGAVQEAGIGICWGTTIHPSIARSGTFLAAVEKALGYFKAETGVIS